MDFSTLNDPSVLVFVIPPVLVALNELFKKLGMDSKFAPIVNVAGGLVAIFPLMAMGLTLLPAVVGGLIVGLSAGGFYTLKKIVE